MRTIKFRGKEISTGKWVFGFYTQGGFIDPYKGKETIRHIIHADFLYDVDPDTVGQFTGLKDCMGREVYEGDIVMYDGSPEFGRRLVVFYEESFNIATWQEYECLQRGSHPYMNDYAHMTCLNDWSNTGLVKVVGNIHDTPELIEGR